VTRARGLFAAALLATTLGGIGCVTPPRDLREPLDDALPVALDDPGLALGVASLANTASDRHSLVGRARVSLDGPELRFSRPQRMAVQTPGKMRIEILGLFDQVAAILATDGRRYQLFEPGAEIQQGPVYPGLLWAVARVDLEPEEAVSLLLGTPWQPRARLEAAAAVKGGGLLLSFRSPIDGGRRIFELDAERRLVRVRQRAADDVLVWEAVYADYRPVGTRTFAHEIEIDFPEVDSHVDFRFETAELNRTLPASAFDLQPRRAADLQPRSAASF
jgi:hypothetical protein